MNDDAIYKLVGLADPSGVSLGFLVPLFSDGRSNTPLVQLVDEDGAVSGFEPYGAPDAAPLPVPAMERSIGERAIYAFAFGKGDVEMATRDDLAPFSGRLDDPVLAKRPLVAMELADFLQLIDRRCEFAALAHADMRRASDEIADHWRDLSVLTIELRRELARRPHRSAKRLANVVVARVSGRVVEIAGAGDRPGTEQFASLKAAALAALATLSPLYPPPAQGWDVRLRWQQHKEHDGVHEAALLLASPRALNRGTRGTWLHPPDVEIFTRDGPEFARVVEETQTPLFVAYDSREPEQMRRATGDWTVREMHGIGIAAPRRLPVEADRQLWRTTHVLGASFRSGAAQAEPGILAGMRLAIAAELDRRAADISWLPRNALLLRARGLAPDPNADAWATLYDRAWALGAAPWNSLLLRGPESMPILSGPQSGSVVDALFHEPRYVGSDLVRQVMEKTRSTAALLVDTSPRSEEDGRRHRLTVSRLLQRQGWEISDRNAGADLVIEGRRARIALAIAAESNLSAISTTFDARDIDLRSIDGVVVTCAASPGAVLERLARTRELAIDVRDLIGLNAREATTLSLLGAQLQRIITGLPSRSRTQFLAMLIMQAFRWGRVDAEGAPLLDDALHAKDFGKRIHLAVSSVRVENGWASAEVRLLTSDEEGVGSNRTEHARYRLTVEPETFVIADA
ncbi:hypothetical protein [Ensifer aridi]|uniref:hypothetical protein n=1 Tax=Ensifer aridi TaxID=1708715 RepID=UPI000A1139FB|nr:hypothetical protein [Ensifer aridi]